MNAKKYDILTLSSIKARGHMLDIEALYGPIEGFEEGYYRWESEYTTDANSEDGTNVFKIFYRKMGTNEKAPPILLLHGLPSNSDQYIEVQRYLSRFFRTIAIDMLDSGRSSKPTKYTTMLKDDNPWMWKYDVLYIYNLMSDIYINDTKFIFIADDYGANIALTYCCSEKYGPSVNHLFLLNPTLYNNNTEYLSSFANYSSKYLDMKQVYSMMSTEMDNYTLMSLLSAYSEPKDIEVLKDRIIAIDRNQVLPITETNTKGIDYDNMKCAISVISASEDKISNPTDAQTIRNMFDDVMVFIDYVDDSGHLLVIDQPRKVSEIIINRIQAIYGREILSQPFFGLRDNLRGTEMDQKSMFM